MKAIMFRTVLLATAAAGICGSAQAQTSPAPAAEQDAESDDASGDIVVTARRREERLLDVPVSVTLLTGEGLAAKGVTRVDDLPNATPSLKLTPAAGRRSASAYQLRGISASESLITQDPTVGIYVNDVYRARATGTNQSFYDIANVQTLYGPQGTLFGRNATGGAILINTNKPTDQLEGSLEVSYGRFDRFQATAVLNVPLSDTLQVRLAGQRLRSDGFGTNVSTGGQLGGTNTWSGRASILFNPTSAIENLLVVSGYKANDQGTVNVLYGTRTSGAANEFGQVPALSRSAFLAGLANASLANQRVIGPYRAALDAPGATITAPGLGTVPLGAFGLTAPLLNGTRTRGADPFERARNVSVSNTTTVELSDTITLKNIFGYNYTSLTASTDLDATPIKLIDTYYETTNKQYSNEFQIQGESGRLNWVVGGLYFIEKGLDYQPAVQFVQFFATSRLAGVNKSMGAFAQGTYAITDQLNFTAGARYTKDKRRVRYSELLGGLSNLATPGVDLLATSGCFLLPALINDGTCARAVSASFSEPSWTASLDYKPSEDVLFYLAHRHGYRSGGFNTRILNGSAADQLDSSQPFRPETVNDVELGFKGTFRTGDVVIRPGLALYKAWYKDLQKQGGRTTAAGTGITLIQNSGGADVKGLEANLGLSFGRMVNLETFLGIVDGKYKDYPSQAVPTTFVSLPFGASKYTGGATLTVTPIDDDSTGRISGVASWSFQSSYFSENSLPTRNQEAKVGSQNNLNLELNWENIAGSNFGLSAWAKNVTNEVRYLGVLDLIPGFGLAVATVGEPRTYGLTLKFRFGDR